MSLVRLAFAALLALPAALHELPAQGRWRAIGKTVVGNPIFLDERSVARAKGITTATFRVTMVKPVKTPRGPVTSSRTVAMFDCAKKQVAIKENTFYHDEKANRIYDHRVVGIPGFTAPLGGSMPEVAMGAVCPR